MPADPLQPDAAPQHVSPDGACVTCGSALVGHFCHQCGEKRAEERDLTLRAFADYAAEALFNADGKLWISLRRLVGRPGFLTREFVDGRRRPYIGPLQLFLISNLLFFVLLQFGIGMQTFTTDLLFHGSQPIYGSVAESMITERIGAIEARDGRTWQEWMATLTPEQQEYRERFNDAAPRYANSMVVLMAPMMAFGFLLLRRRTLYVRELVLSLHFMAFVMLFTVAFTLAAAAFLVSVRFALRGVDWETAGPLLHGFVNVVDTAFNSELVISGLILGVLAIHLALAFRTAHGDGLAAATIRAVVSIAFFFVVLSLYRGLLFFVVFRAVPA